MLKTMFSLSIIKGKKEIKPWKGSININNFLIPPKDQITQKYTKYMVHIKKEYPPE